MKIFLSSVSSKTSNKGTYMLQETWKSYMHEPYRPDCFQHSCTYETGISDFHKMTLTVLKTLIKKKKKKLLDTVITNHMITLLSEKSFIKNSHLYLQKTKP